MVSPQVQVYFKPAYECIVSFITFVDNRLVKNSDLGTAWAARVKEQLQPEFLKELTGKTLQKDLARLATFMALAHQQPPNSTREFLDWFTELNIKELLEHFPFSPDILNNFLANLEAVKRACTLLGEWDRQYFQGIEPRILTDLEEEARQTEALAQETEAASFVEQITGGVVLDDISMHKRIILVPQYHARPFNYYDVHTDLFVSFYPKDPERQAGEPSYQLKRLTSALSDESRLKILKYLAGGERSFTDIVKSSGLAKSTVYYHMILLRAAGLSRVHLKANDTMSYSLSCCALEQVAYKLQEFIAPVECAAAPIIDGKEGE